MPCLWFCNDDVSPMLHAWLDTGFGELLENYSYVPLPQLGETP